MGIYYRRDPRLEIHVVRPKFSGVMPEKGFRFGPFWKIGISCGRIVFDELIFCSGLSGLGGKI